jgi:hypothetical protein
MSLTVKRPSREREEQNVERAAQRLGAGEKRLVADVPEHIHRQVKMRCLERGVLIRDYVLELLARDGVR